MPNTTPQITYAVSLHLSKEAEERISLAVKITDQIKLPLESQAKEIALYQCHPILEELKRFTLG
ncbi:MAG: hypothetical protein J6X67_08495 [Treponema sp.]|nr:hypothetical protein [Treponema sp.]